MTRYGIDTFINEPFADRTCFPAQSSVLDEEALLNRVVPEYDLSTPTACRFLCRGASDVYTVDVSGTLFYVKIYRPPHSVARAEAEARFLTQLHSRGAAVVPPVQRLDHRYATEAMAPEGPRPILMFAEAPHDPFKPTDAVACRALGRGLAALHEHIDALDEKYDLPVLDTRRVINRALPIARTRLSPEDYSFTEHELNRLAGLVESLPTAGPDFGLCHCDLALCNIRRTADGQAVFFDFGEASYTWRADELARLCRCLGPESQDGSSTRDALFAGYTEVRRLPQGVPDYFPVLTMLDHILDFTRNLVQCRLRMGTEDFGESFISESLAGHREMAKHIPDTVPRDVSAEGDSPGRESYCLVYHTAEPRLLVLEHGAGVMELPHMMLSRVPWEVGDAVSLAKDRYGIEMAVLRLVNRGEGDPFFLLECEFVGDHSDLPSGVRWVNVLDVPPSLLRKHPFLSRLRQWWNELQSPPPGRRSWNQLGWLEQARAWVTDQLARGGTNPPFVFRGVKVGNPFHFVTAIETQEARFFFKAGDHGREAELTEALRQWYPGQIPEVVAVDASRNWMLMRDFGDRLSDLPEDPACYARMLRQFSLLQIDSTEHIGELMALGCPDLSVASIENCTF